MPPSFCARSASRRRRCRSIRAAGKVIRNDQVWQLNDASAQVGESNLAGRLSVDLSRPRPFISADLESDRLRAQDLRVAPAAPAQPSDADGSQKPAPPKPPQPSGTDGSQEAATPAPAQPSDADGSQKPAPPSRRSLPAPTEVRRPQPPSRRSLPAPTEVRRLQPPSRQALPRAQRLFSRRRGSTSTRCRKSTPT